eukprot:GHVS01051031.1.p1 GENE.GHVS01051031.1~~GHVS01051031.1.p1  ORF type:complete len:177 (+),score=30.19 GHVS01051031.1:128-658(+)
MEGEHVFRHSPISVSTNLLLLPEYAHAYVSPLRFILSLILLLFSSSPSHPCSPLQAISAVNINDCIGVDTRQDVEQFVNGLIADHELLVISKSFCSHCTETVEFLRTFHPTELHIEDIDNNPNMDTIQDYLESLTGARSVPRVFVGHNFFGGGDKTCAKATSGELLKLLKAAGVVA